MSDTFGARLERILIDRNMTQTDLARLVWNETYADKRGYEVVKGKDAISSYITGRRQPSPLVYNKILNALRISEDELPIRRRQVMETREQRGQALKKSLLDDIASLTAERDYWRDTAKQSAELAMTLAVTLKELRQ